MSVVTLPAFQSLQVKLTLRRVCYNHALRQVAYLFNKVILCIQEHAVMFVQVYANPLIGKRIMNTGYLEMGGPA